VLSRRFLAVPPTAWWVTAVWRRGVVSWPLAAVHGTSASFNAIQGSRATLSLGAGYFATFREGDAVLRNFLVRRTSPLPATMSVNAHRCAPARRSRLAITRVVEHAGRRALALSSNPLRTCDTSGRSSRRPSRWAPEFLFRRGLMSVSRGVLFRAFSVFSQFRSPVRRCSVRDDLRRGGRTASAGASYENTYVRVRDRHEFVDSCVVV